MGYTLAPAIPDTLIIGGDIIGTIVGIDMAIGITNG
jgi:hypothetical protein